jgi:hypothetical protein
VNRVDDRANLGLVELGIERQRQHLAGDPLGDLEAHGVDAPGVGRMSMDGQRVMNRGADATARELGRE